MSYYYRPVLLGAFLTILTLFGGLLVGLVLGDLIFRLIPGHNLNNPSPTHVAIAALPALFGFLAGGAAWGYAMGRLAGSTEIRRMAVAGLLGFGPITIFLAVGLSVAEPPLVASFGASTGIHRIFTLLFVPSAFLIAGISAWAIGRGLRDSKLAWSLFWQVGLTAGITFLVVNRTMESLDWVVGGPGAAERATMVTVLALGDIFAALTGGAVLGWRLSTKEGALMTNSRGTILLDERETSGRNLG
jgi:hypothetical protein